MKKKKNIRCESSDEMHARPRERKKKNAIDLISGSKIQGIRQYVIQAE